MENKRDLWSYDETLALINILKEKQILKIMDNKRFRIAEIFKSLEHGKEYGKEKLLPKYN